MTAKEIQIEFIKTYLKPTLKTYGFKTSGQTWWKNKGDFSILINLQNSQWNSKEELSFCLNIGVAITNLLEDKQKKKVTHFDNATPVREDFYLTEERIQLKKLQGGWLGYKITDKTDIAIFINEFKIDLEEHILKIIDGFNDLNDCVKFYDKSDMQGSNLRSKILQAGLNINEDNASH